MKKYLMILEVSRKQEYIFSSKKLVENANRSRDIAYITSNQFFEDTAKELYSAKDNFVYAGGGHTVLEFDDRQQAQEFARCVTKRVIEVYHGLEMFVKIMESGSEKAADNLKNLSIELEKKKSLRKESFKNITFGIETDAEDSENSELKELRKGYPKSVEAPAGCTFPIDFDKLSLDSVQKKGLKDNFIAVVHIDGNAMGTRVASIYGKGQEWDELKLSLRRFSEGIQKDFEGAFKDTVEEVLRRMPDIKDKSGIIPIRPVVLAGDDVCFVTAGSIGLECARIYLEKLSRYKNAEDNENYSACAGVAVIHRKYPFFNAYELSEELCSNAKRVGAGYDEARTISAIDWHIEYGQMKDGLDEIREDYQTEDGNRMELRPYIVINPANKDIPKESYYEFFKAMCMTIQGQIGDIARGKIKELRNAIRQGELESMYFVKKNNITQILNNDFAAIFRDDKERMDKYIQLIKENGSMQGDLFVTIDRYGSIEKRNILFDAIEMIDNCIFFTED